VKHPALRAHCIEGSTQALATPAQLRNRRL
jgi:hypothetical protein